MWAVAFCNSVKAMKKLPAYPHLDGLVDLACRDGVDIRPTLLRVLTDLYVQKPSHSDAEEIQYVELALGLLDTVDEPTRVAVAASLARYPAAPVPVLRKLGNAEVLLNSDVSTLTEPETGDLIEQFFAADSDHRRVLLANVPVSEAHARGPVPASSEVIRRLEAAALQHNAGEFGRILERALGISAALAARVTRDPLGEPIVIAAKALGMTAAVVQRILLFLNPEIGKSVGQVHDLARLFDDLKPEIAERMVAIWRKNAPMTGPVTGRKPTHESVHYDDERRSARPSAPAARRSLTSRDDLPARNRSGR
jgi:uncharacterized protein (DUF2336 family)